MYHYKTWKDFLIIIAAKNKPIVANIHSTFFRKSETFIFNNLSSLRYFKPICLAFDYINIDQFPLPQEDLYYFNNKHFLDWSRTRRMKRISNAVSIISGLNAKLIHAHFGHNGYNTLPLKRKVSLPLVTTFYDFDASKLPRKRRWRKRYKVLFEQGDLFLVEGKHMGSRLIELGCPAEKIQIQRIAIPLERISFVPRNPKIEEKVIFIFSGRFVEKKGLIYALQAIERIKNKFSNFEFRIIGDGPQKNEIESFIEKHNLHTFVKILGFLTYDDYLGEMSKADIFIHPSVIASDGDSEGGAPTTILEAQAMGMPVISTYHADIPNIVVPNKSALLSNEKDVNSLASNILYLLKNQTKWQSMGIEGRKFVESFHDVRIEVDNLENKYKSLLY